MRCTYQFLIASCGILLLGVMSLPASAQGLGSSDFSDGGSSDEDYIGGEAGMMGGGYGMESMGMDGMMGGMSAPVRMHTFVNGPDGKPKKLNSDTFHVFGYELGSLRPKLRQQQGMYDMMGGMGAPGMGGMAGGGMSAGYGGEGGYGGGEYGGGGYGGDGGDLGMAGGSQTKNISIHAFLFKLDGARDKIELVVPFSDIARARKASKLRQNEEDFANAIQSPGGPHRFVLLTTLSEKLDLISESEAQLVGDMIRQSIWKKDAIKELNRVKNQPAELATLEKELWQLLTEEYDTQLARQELEISGIEKRILALREELSRRKAAKSRVVDVQLGNIVLEAQGLLGQ